MTSLILFLSFIFATTAAMSTPVDDQQCKKPNERYTHCLPRQCTPITCDDLGKRIVCPSMEGTFCTGGCICAEDFVKNSEGVCIEKIKCPSCRGDPNAQSGCDNPCGKTCNSRGIDMTVMLCPRVCSDNGCDCKEGFLLDTDSNKCVPEQSCPNPPKA